MAGPEVAAQAGTSALKEATLVERNLVASGALSGLHHQVIVRGGDIWSELQRVIRHEHIDLVVVGTHGRSGLKKLVPGSVAEQIFRHARCPVLTVGPQSPTYLDLDDPDKIGPLLFAADFSETSLTALPFAVSFANQRRARLVLSHMLPPAPKVDRNRWYTADCHQ